MTGLTVPCDVAIVSVLTKDPAPTRSTALLNDAARVAWTHECARRD
jgi:hypothetical protein